MKPTLEQVREWIAQIKSDSGEAYTQELCELAAAWGASQAQQTTVEEPELPEAVAWVKGLPEGTTHYSAGTPFNECGSAFDVVVRAFKYDDDGDLLVYRTDNDGEYGGWAKAESLFKVVPDTHHLHAFTAAQMHDHFAAGVLVGTAQQSQDAKRLRALLRPYFGYAPGSYMCKCRTCEKTDEWVDKRATTCKECADAAIDAAMQGDKQ